jgi:predicted HAD superfamily Cof-like phosphohydrolase
MATNFEKVVDFNKTFGLAHYDEPQLNIFTENETLTKLRYDLIAEEISELQDAYTAHDFIEVIDALTDIQYVVYGAASSFGFNMDDFYTRFYGDREGTIFSSLYNDNTFERINMNIETFRTFNVENTKAKIYLDLLLLDLNMLNRNLFENKDYYSAQNTLTNILRNTYILGIFFGINIDQSFEIVHSSNMSKVCQTEQEAIDTVEWYKANETRYDSPAYRLCYDNQRYVVYNESTGKILKSIKYVPADFTTMVS